MKKPVRPIRFDGDVAYITLTKGFTAVIDAADAHIVSGFNWFASVDYRPDGSVRAAYAVRWGQQNANGKRLILMHRVISGASPGIDVDHISGDGTDNRRVNLRQATPTQNQRNQRIRVSSSSGVKGVSLHKSTGKWRAQIRIEGKNLHLGRFESIEEATEAYAKASAEMHGAFGRTATLANHSQESRGTQ